MRKRSKLKPGETLSCRKCESKDVVRRPMILDGVCGLAVECNSCGHGTFYN